MAIVRYSYSEDKDKKLTEHFSVWEFRSYNETTNTLTTDTILIDENLPKVLEELYQYCDKKYGGLKEIRITSGYRDQNFENYLGGYLNGNAKNSNKKSYGIAFATGWAVLQNSSRI